MSILERARLDLISITSNSDHFAVDIKLTAPGGEIANIKGLHKKHHTGVDAETGEIINSKIASVSFAEKFLENYPFKINGEVFLKGHLVAVKDSSGTEKNYVVKEFYPDETLGIIVCILSWD